MISFEFPSIAISILSVTSTDSVMTVSSVLQEVNKIIPKASKNDNVLSVSNYVEDVFSFFVTCAFEYGDVKKILTS